MPLTFFAGDLFYRPYQLDHVAAGRVDENAFKRAGLQVFNGLPVDVGADEPDDERIEQIHQAGYQFVRTQDVFEQQQLATRFQHAVQLL